MVKINKIYTKTGDDGTTGLVGGKRISKDAVRVDAYGDIDELNAFVGSARTVAEDSGAKEQYAVLEQIQHDLFDLGALLATPAGEDHDSLPNFGEKQISQLEKWIDSATNKVEELRSFVLPGGNELNALLHICRTVCRRAERKIAALHREEPVPESLRTYMNRLSDLFFALARKATADTGGKEFLWTPSKGVGA